MKDWLYVLLLHLIRCPQTISRAVDKVDPEDLQQFYEDEMVYLWTLSRNYYKEYHKPIPQIHLEQGLQEFLLGAADADIDELANFIKWVYDAEEQDLNFEEAVKHLRKLLHQTRVNSKMSELLSGGADPDTIYEEVGQAVQHATIGNAVVLNPMQLMRTELGLDTPTPLGGNDIKYFNTLCQGGLMEGEVTLLIGPTGGFKSTIALDVMCSMGSVNQYTAFIGYEQGLRGGDLLYKFWTRMTGKPRETWDEKEAHTKFINDPANKDAVMEADVISEHVQWLDRADKTDKVSDIVGLIQELEHKGKKPELIVIDQLIPWLSRWPEYEKAQDKRHVIQSAMLRLKHDVAEKFGTRIIMLHQMTAALGGRGSNYKPTIEDIAEIKGLGQWVDFVIHIGNMCKETRCTWGITTKHRRGVPTELILRTDGQYGRISIADDMEYDVHGGRKFVRSGEKNKVPDAPSKLAKGSEDYGL